ncbi:MAG: hypothetical protein NC110_05920 [Ruminococcus sp.]|nr:hypothetical protein [Ruminococcus sp.]
MTDRELKKLSRAELIEIIYQLQLKQEELTEMNRKLKKQMKSIDIRISQAGSIAEAALSINEVFESAQKAADQYLQGICASKDDLEARYNRMVEDAEQKAAEIIGNAEERSRIIREQTDREIENKWDEFNVRANQILEKYKKQIFDK